MKGLIIFPKGLQNMGKKERLDLWLEVSRCPSAYCSWQTVNSRIEHLLRKIRHIAGNVVACEKVGHIIAECVTVVSEQLISLWPEEKNTWGPFYPSGKHKHRVDEKDGVRGLPQPVCWCAEFMKILHKHFHWYLRHSQLHHLVWLTKDGTTLEPEQCWKIPGCHSQRNQYISSHTWASHLLVGSWRFHLLHRRILDHRPRSQCATRHPAAFLQRNKGTLENSILVLWGMNIRQSF